MEATNYDIGLEYYLSDFSYVSLNFFKKFIKNDIYKVLSENISYQGVLLDEYVTYVNADEGELTGLEFNFQYEFDNLPGMFLAFNFTNTEGDNESPFDRTERIPFRKLSENNANFSIGYDKDKFDLRLANLKSNLSLSYPILKLALFSESFLNGILSVLSNGLSLSPSVLVKLKARNIPGRLSNSY